MRLRLPKNWKSPTKLLVFLITFSLVGCSTYSTNVRPSFDENYEKKSRESTNVRPSYKEKQKVKQESKDLKQKEVDDNISEFEIEPKEETKKIEETPPKSLRGGEIKKSADKYLGSPYHYGGTTKRGFDCSGFVWRVYQDVGYTNFQREPSQAMFNRGKSISQNSAREGDLVFFYVPRSRKNIDHVGIYIGDEQFIHASSSKGIMYNKLTDVYWKDNFAGIKRLLP